MIAESQAHRTDEIKQPKQFIADEEEMYDYQMKKRTEYEASVQRQRNYMGNWLKYAKWEENLGEFRRARSIFERALEVDHQSITLYLKYAEMEMKNKFVNHDRNIWERAIKTLPRVEQLWYKYAYMEEILGNFDFARDIFKNWMTWKHTKNAWMSYIKFEQRQNLIENCREIFLQFIEAYPEWDTYVKAAKFEEKLKNFQRAREYYEKCFVEIGNDALNEDFFLKFIAFEKRMFEYERVHQLYKFGISHIHKDKQNKINESYLEFQKEHGDPKMLDDLLFVKKVKEYEEKIKESPYSYDYWIDYLLLLENSGKIEETRKLYERAVSKVPIENEKKYWIRYIYIWIYYATFEELDAKCPSKAIEIYKECLKMIPHEKFTFSKIWINLAHLYLRQEQLEEARKTFGIAIGKCKRPKIFKAYIEQESLLGNIERCRKIYEKYVLSMPQSSVAWIAYAEMEKSLQEHQRAKSIYEIALNQEVDYLEQIWKAYIDFEIQQDHYENARKLYERLLLKTQHVKVWISYAKFEFSIQSIAKSREIWNKAYQFFKQTDLKEERKLIVEQWKNMEEKIGDVEGIKRVDKLLPKKVIKRRKIDENIANLENRMVDEEGWEEYYDYLFPDDSNDFKNQEFLKNAHKWFEEKNQGDKPKNSELKSKLDHQKEGNVIVEMQD